MWELLLFHVFSFIKVKQMYPGVIMCFPDGVTYSKGYVKDLDEAKSYITLDDEVPSS